MRLIFRGTKGEIEETSKIRKKNSYLILSYQDKNYALDFGYDWKPNQLKEDKITAIWLSHLHPDHAHGLLNVEIKIPVYVSKRSWTKYRKPEKKKFLFEPILVSGKFKFEEIPAFEFPVFHSLIAPASGLILKTKPVLAYVPDVLSIKNRRSIMTENKVEVLIADSASIKKPIVRRKDDEVYGHASMQNILRWAKIDEIPNVIFTHYGVEGIGFKAEDFLKRLDIPPGVKVNFAYDNYVKEF